MVWAAEAVCERPGSPAGLQCALSPRGVVRLWPGVECGGYRSTLRKRPFKRGGRAAHVSTSTAAPACGGEVGGCSGGVQRLGNLGGRAGARAGRDCSDIELGKDPVLCAGLRLRVRAREHSFKLVSQDVGHYKKHCAAPPEPMVSKGRWHSWMHAQSQRRTTKRRPAA